MQPTELALWSAASGAIALVVLTGLADYLMVRHVAALHGTVYNAAALAFVVLMSGIAGALLPASWAPGVRLAKVLVGPLCVLLGDLFIRQWFGARHRDRLMDGALLASGTLVPVLAVAALFLLRREHQLPAAAGLVIFNTVLVTWMGLRAWLLGDSLALGIAIGSGFMIGSVSGLYAIALGTPVPMVWQALIAAGSAICVAVTGFALWQRNQHARRVRNAQEVHSEYDPVTKLPAGMPLVRRLLRAQQRRRRTRREGAVLAVLVFEPERVRLVAGVSGLNEVYVHLAQRMQHQVGLVNPVGRYWERCFIAVMETIRSPAAVRTLGLRVASALRKPMQVTGHDGSPLEVRLDIGVGVLLLKREHEHVEDLLHEAQQLAEAARGLASRAATIDPVTGEVVAVEHAQLGPQRGARRTVRTPSRGARGRA
ncbi:7TM diverse intracellular signaling domain-containing protein [Ramlibacter sp. PS4R-6]|uniref:7TM diverse intracellular signaling domain-containing protein n=1 Tax=Ramlibacter sp. PS4R-6 TaxID=3133438 RepID=UPI0030B213A1